MELRDQQLRLLWTARIDYSNNSCVDTHQHEDFCQLVLILEGEGHIELMGKKHLLMKNGFYFIPRQAIHHMYFYRSTVTIDFKFEVTDEVLTSQLFNIPYHGTCSADRIAEFRRWYKWSIDQIRQPNPYLPICIDAGFKGSLISLLGSNLIHYPVEKKMTIPEFEMARYIFERWNQPLSLEDLARHFGFHPHYIIRLFHEQLGMTPTAYIQMLRMEKAKDMLEFTFMTLNEIADTIGWSSPYFSRFFKQQTGIPPSLYREQSRTSVGKDVVLSSDFTNEWRVIQA